MALNVAVQMDPIDKINIAGDSTFALLLEARARGHKLLYYTPDKLSLSEGRVVAAATVVPGAGQRAATIPYGAAIPCGAALRTWRGPALRRTMPRQRAAAGSPSAWPAGSGSARHPAGRPIGRGR